MMMVMMKMMVDLMMMTESNCLCKVFLGNEIHMGSSTDSTQCIPNHCIHSGIPCDIEHLALKFHNMVVAPVVVSPCRHKVMASARSRSWRA